MPDLLVTATVALAALVASTVAAVAGFGGSVILLPVLVWAFGIRDAVPILTLVQLIGNLSRVFFNRRELVLPVVGWFAVGAVPAAVVGGTLFTAVPADILQRLLGLFLLLSVAFRRTRAGRRARVGLRGFVAVGGVSGFLSGLVGTAGPLVAPFFLSYGLVKAWYIGTDSLSAVVVHVVKLLVYGRSDLLATTTVASGAAIGLVMIVGSYAGKRILDRLPERVFHAVIEATLVLSGLQFLLSA